MSTIYIVYSYRVTYSFESVCARRNRHERTLSLFIVLDILSELKMHETSRFTIVLKSCLFKMLSKRVGDFHNIFVTLCLLFT